MGMMDGKVVVVTGAGRGVGRGVALLMAAEGAQVVVNDIGAALDGSGGEQTPAQEVVDEIEAAGGKALPCICDVRDEESVKRAVAEGVAAFGGIDILVNNAGATWGAPAEDHPIEAWDKVMNLNIRSVFLFSQAVAKASMIPNKGGRIINVASIAGLVGRNPDAYNSIAYGSSKGALVNFTRDLAIKWARHNIRVNAICPGFFVTDINRKVYDERPEKIDREIPLGKPGGDSDIKGAAVWLASDASRFVTGAIIPVDGGTTAW